MSSAGPAQTRWTDEEKIATLLAIIKANGSTPNWKETKIPIGRTMQSTQKMYESLKKQAAAVEMVGADKQTPSKVMGPRKSPIKKRGTAAGGATATNGKRGRPAKQKDVGEVENGHAHAQVNGGGAGGGGITDDEDDEDNRNDNKKRVKLEHQDDLDRPLFGNGETWGFGGV